MRNARFAMRDCGEPFWENQSASRQMNSVLSERKNGLVFIYSHFLLLFGAEYALNVLYFLSRDCELRIANRALKKTPRSAGSLFLIPSQYYPYKADSTFRPW